MRLRRHLLWWLRAKAMRIARRHYMASFTIVALAAAAAGAIGYFDATDDPPVRAQRLLAIPTPIPYVTPSAGIPTDPLVVTFVLVATEEHLRVMDSFESGLIWREILRHGTFETLLVTNAEQEAEALRTIAAARERGRTAGFEVVVQDMRYLSSPPASP